MVSQNLVSQNLAMGRRRLGQTERRDAWWVGPLVILVCLSSFVAYATWAAFQGKHYHWGPYISPFYSPELFGESPHSIFGLKPSWWPGWLIWSPALLILWAPAGFRLTCYYYRGAYYKAFSADPPACTVGEPRQHYVGERSGLLVLQNLHRYFLYLALLFLVSLAYDVWKALWFENPGNGRMELGLGLGTFVLAANVVLLGGYAMSCHSLRHLIGGGFDRPSQAPVRWKLYRCVSCLNRRHGLWAWMSLFWVAFSDFYVRMCAMGVWSDWRIL